MSNQKRQSAWILNLFSIRGIPLRVHYSFFLLLAWVAIEARQSGESALLEVAFVTSIFLCVLLHELGHALTARRYGISTREIVLYPFGGVAVLNREPHAWAELVISLAGPAVNILIVFLIAPFLPVNFSALTLESTDSLLHSFFGNLLLSNLFLVIFNMIPALPMDGGRVFRAILSILKVQRATVIAGRTSQVISALMGGYAIYIGNPILLIISILVFTSAFKEVFHFKAKSSFRVQRALDFMTEAERLHTLPHGTTLSEAMKVSLRSLQSAFPVLYSGEVIGVVDKDSLLRAASEGEQQYISAIMSRDFPHCQADAGLSEILAKVEGTSLPVTVLENKQLLGMIFKEKLMEYLMLEGLRESIGQQEDDESL